MVYNMAMKIIAIDPGYERVGIAVLEKTTYKEVLLYSDCFRTSVKQSLPARIFEIGQEVARVIAEFKPDVMALEKLFFTTNQKTAMGVSEARGVMMYEASRNNISIVEYTPMEIKVAVTGYGKAGKTDVYKMVEKLIALPPKKMLDDEVDAIAVGLTAFAHKRLAK
jgi:crossover junction endodeoxyribonuclease RuvC